MNLAQSSMTLLAVAIAVVSVWWLSTTLKEARKAIESKKQ